MTNSPAANRENGGFPAPAPQPRASREAELLDSEQILRGRRLVEIRHNGELYRLQTTRSGKLILTK